MTFELLVLPQAAKWYERKLSGLGRRLIAQFDENFSAIRASPFRQAEIGKQARRKTLRDFPYSVFYVVK